MGASSASIASPPQNNGLTPVSNNGGKAGGSGKSGMSSIQPSNQTLTANTDQPAMGAPAAYSNTITPDQTAPGAIGQPQTGKTGISGTSSTQPQSFGKGQ